MVSRVISATLALVITLMMAITFSMLMIPENCTYGLVSFLKDTTATPAFFLLCLLVCTLRFLMIIVFEKSILLGFVSPITLILDILFCGFTLISAAINSFLPGLRTLIQSDQNIYIIFVGIAIPILLLFIWMGLAITVASATYKVYSL